MAEKRDLPEEFRVPYGRQFLAYVLDMASKITGKPVPDAQTWRAHRLTDPASPLTDEMSARLRTTVSPADCRMVLEEMAEVFRTKGFVLPWEMERQITERFEPGIPRTLIAAAERFAALDHQPEPMTGWHQKAFGGLIVAQAALYKKATGHPVAIFDADLSNMRGTNDLYYRLLCLTEGQAWNGSAGARDSTLQQDAENLTDRAVRILAAIAIRETGGDGIRNGGDELRIVAPLFPEDRDKAMATVDAIHWASESATARMGLHDHPHGKPDHAINPNRNGFGNAAGWFWLPADDLNFAIGVKQAEAEIEGAKAGLAVLRRTGRLYDHEKDPAYSFIPSLTHLPAPASDAERADQAAKARACLDASIRAMENLERTLGIGPPEADRARRSEPNLHRLARMAGAQDFYHLPQDPELRALSARAFRESLWPSERIAFESLEPREKILLEMMAAHAPARDYVCGAYSGQDLAPLADIVLSVNESLRRRAFDTLPETYPDRAALMKPGFLAIGASINTAGFNKHLGHATTDAILEHFNRTILVKGLEAAGLRPENACTVHLGGGDFVMLLQSAVPQADGRWRAVTEADADTIMHSIAQATDALNREPCTAFLQQSFNKASRAPAYALLGDIPDTRVDNARGVRLFKTQRWLSAPANQSNAGGLIAGLLRQHIESEKKAAAPPEPAAAPDSAPAPSLPAPA